MIRRSLTIVLPFYKNLGQLDEQQRVWAAYPQPLKDALHAIVVDDCSPKAERPGRKMLRDTGIASLRLYRCLPVPKDLRALPDGSGKVRWNWLFARNLGMHQATTEWVLLTDIDHVLPADTLERIVCGELDERSVYRTSRADAPHPWPWSKPACRCGKGPIVYEQRGNKRVYVSGCSGLTPYKEHPNTWLMTRPMYDRIGGYDERLSGCYGTDGEFRDRVREHARAVVMLPDVLVRYPREIIPDASTDPAEFTRKNDEKNDTELEVRRARRSREKDQRPKRLTFPWEFVASVPDRQERVA